MSSCTKNFQKFWIDNVLSEKIHYHYNESFYKEIDRFIEEGADINSIIESEMTTPLYNLLVHIHNNDKYEIVYYLLSKNVAIDIDSLMFCIYEKKYKLLEDLLIRCDDSIIESIKFSVLFNTSCLEILLGFNRIDIETVNFKFGYMKNDRILIIDYQVYPIESLLLDYSVEHYHKSFKDELRNKVYILKKNGSPDVCLEKINYILVDISKKSETFDKKYRNKFKKIYNYCFPL